jgi:lipid A ethanolaminephosphotransferase
VRFLVNPVFPIYSALQVAVEQTGSAAPASLALRSTFVSKPAPGAAPKLVVLVVGETARADHFSLNGYSRETNPKLRDQSRLISYSNITSCGTSTAVSVPCMFSFDSREDFQIDAASDTENVLDILAKAGVNVLWRDNNSSSKGVADRLNFENFRSRRNNPVCDEECRDIGMLSGLKGFVDSRPGDTLIVLHQMGSHGPAYFKRYPRSFERFEPVCATAELSQCTNEEIVNAYDNSILYTDYFLNETIGFLKENEPGHQTALLYVSDHGESLGENGIYLHGLPYVMAPDAQTGVPVLAWVGGSTNIDFERTVALKDQPGSQDALARTLMEIFEVQSDVEMNRAHSLLALLDATPLQ